MTTDAHTPPADPVAPEPEPTPSVPRPRRSRWRVPLWPSVCGLQFALLVTGYVVWTGNPAGDDGTGVRPGATSATEPPQAPKPGSGLGHEPEDAGPEHHKDSSPRGEGSHRDEHAASGADAAEGAAGHDPHPAPAVAEVTQGDQLAAEGRWDVALGVYEAALARDRGAAIQYRVALAREAVGQTDEALNGYRAIIGHAQDPAVVAAAQIGQARVWLRRNQPGQAKVLLAQLLLQSADPGLKPKPFREDLQYMYGIALAIEATPEPTPSPLSDEPLAYPPGEWPLHHALGWVIPQPGAGAARRPQKSPDHGAGAVSVAAVVAQPEVSLVRVTHKDLKVTEFLERLAAGTGLTLRFTPGARKAVEGRHLSVAAEDETLARLSDKMAAVLGLVWKVDRKDWAWALESEWPAAAVTAARRSAALDAVRQGILQFPGGTLSPVALIEMGNLEAAAGKLDEAVTWYERLQQDMPRTPSVVVASFNLGLARRRLGHFPEARTAFYRVIDQAPGSPLAPAATLWIGRLFLDDRDLDQGITFLRRSLSAAHGTPAEPVLVLMLAAEYLVADQPRAAGLVLASAKDLIAQDPFRRTAAFLDALARYRTVRDSRLAQVQAGELLAAVLELRDEPILGLTKTLLVGQAYRDLNMRDPLVTLFEKALPSAAGPLGTQMTLMLAEVYQEQDRGAVARTLFLKVAGPPDSPWAARAQFHLAELALRAGQPQQCINWARKAFAAGTLDDPGPLLRLMGEAHEQLGEFKLAATCYQGQLPDLDNTP